MMSEENTEVKSLEEHGIKLLTNELDDENCDEVIRFIIESNLNAEHDHLTLIINSPGGYVTCGFAVIDVMEGSRIPIHTVGLGQISSMGLNIFITGAKGHRTLTPNTLIMSHQWAGGRWGKEHELIAQQKQDEIVTRQIIRHYVKHTGLPEKKVREVLLPAHDVFLTALEAKKLGICDIVKEFSNCIPSARKFGESGTKKTAKK
jgi:ATP-dependent Clp protease, protease subunit